MQVGQKSTCDGRWAAQPGFDGIDPKVSDLPDIGLFVQRGMVRLHVRE
jgi:hypothetical protein